MTPLETLLAQPAYYLSQADTVTHEGCSVQTRFSAVGYEERAFVGIVEHVTLETLETS